MERELPHPAPPGVPRGPRADGWHAFHHGQLLHVDHDREVHHGPEEVEKPGVRPAQRAGAHRDAAAVQEDLRGAHGDGHARARHVGWCSHVQGHEPRRALGPATQGAQARVSRG